MMRVLVLVLSLFFATHSYSDCIYNGKVYPEGTKIGPYTCKNERWVK